jgi:DNA-binding NarL/FixJ family response regulator
MAPKAAQNEPIATTTVARHEQEVVVLVARGFTDRHIASELYVSERPIEIHISNILRKLDLASSTEVAAWTTQQRLLVPVPD